jgi:hypothetical protein
MEIMGRFLSQRQGTKNEKQRREDKVLHAIIYTGKFREAILISPKKMIRRGLRRNDSILATDGHR